MNSREHIIEREAEHHRWIDEHEMKINETAAKGHLKKKDGFPFAMFKKDPSQNVKQPSNKFNKNHQGRVSFVLLRDKQTNLFAAMKST